MTVNQPISDEAASIVAKQLEEFENGDKPPIKDIVASIASLVTVAAVIGYGCGWYYTRSYLATLEASWFLNALPYQAIVTAGWPSLSALLLGLFLSYFSMTQGVSEKGARRASILAVSILAAVWFYALQQPADWKWRSELISVVLFLWMTEIGHSLGRIFPTINTRYPLWIVLGTNYGSIFVSLVLVPFLIQQAAYTQAISQLQNGCAWLSKVKIPTLPGNWHIVFLNGEVALVSSCSRDPAKNLNALVKLTEAGVVISNGKADEF